MVPVLTQHEDGCVPFRRCRACHIADILSGTGIGALMDIFNPVSNSSHFETRRLMRYRSPTNPLVDSEIHALLKLVLPEERFNYLMELIGDSKPIEVPSQEPNLPDLKSVLMMPIEELGLLNRTVKALKGRGINLIGDVCMKNEDNLMRTLNFGRKSLNQINGALEILGLHIDMRFPPEVFPAT